MNFRFLRYSLFLSIPATVILSLNGTGWVCWLPLIWAFVFIPILEIIGKPDHSNIDDSLRKNLSADLKFDVWLYVASFLHLSILCLFLIKFSQSWSWDISPIGQVFSMGLMMGNYGINVAHELGHRNNRFHRFMSQVLLLSSQYMHFAIEHNFGHHNKVATPEDPATARFGETVYLFWFRSIVMSWISAFKIEKLRKKNLHQNSILHFSLIQLGLILAIAIVFPQSLLPYLLSALLGILLLETINYIEHYGLVRNKIDSNGYERVQSIHSWNSNHLVGRCILFELSRHSDHHFKPQRKYQTLKSDTKAPQLPYGYPVMMIIALLPPLYFSIMKKELKKIDMLPS